MDSTLRIFIVLVSVLVFFSVIHMLTRRKLNESNSVLWLMIAFFALLFGCFPNIVNRAAAIVGIDYPPTLLFLVSIIMLLLIVFKSSMEISRLQAQINEIAITTAILKEENKKLAAKLEDIFDIEITDAAEKEIL